MEICATRLANTLIGTAFFKLFFGASDNLLLSWSPVPMLNYPWHSHAFVVLITLSQVDLAIGKIPFETLILQKFSKGCLRTVRCRRIRWPGNGKRTTRPAVKCLEARVARMSASTMRLKFPKKIGRLKKPVVTGIFAQIDLCLSDSIKMSEKGSMQTFDPNPLTRRWQICSYFHARRRMLAFG